VKREGKELVLFAVVALAVSLSYYYPFLGSFFSFDDFKYIENFFKGPVDVLLGYGNLRVVSNLAWWPLYAVSGTDPFFYNLFAVIMHAANGVLLYVVLRRFLKNRFLALACALLFLLNAVGCDALFWKAASNTLINVFLYLATLHLYLLYRETGSRRYFGFSIAMYLLAVFSKEDAASMPFVLVLIEVLFFGGLRNWKRTAMLVAPFAAAIILYILAGKVVFDYALHVPVEHAKFFKIRPLHSLLTCWSVFFLAPEGVLNLRNPMIYVTGAFIVASFFYVEDKKLLCLGYGWIFFAFLPQSFTTLGQLEPKYIFNSVSRYLYITSIGSSLVLGAVLLQVKERLGGKIAAAVVTTFFACFIFLNYQMVQARGTEWMTQAEPTARFLKAMKATIPSFPRNADVFVVDAPTGRAYVQQSLRAFYGNPEITWIVDPRTYVPRPGATPYFIVCHWRSDLEVDLELM
jgi:hypothetical protein